jgi:hypothetical protein
VPAGCRCGCSPMQPGEWYLDTAESSGPNDNMTLYLWPNTTNGLPPRTLIAPHLETLVEAHGRGDYAPLQNVSFVGLNFRHAKPTVLSPRGYSVLLGGGDYAMVRAAALVAENVDGLRVDGCSFSRLDGNAILLHSYVRRAVISDNIFFSIGANVSLPRAPMSMVDCCFVRVATEIYLCVCVRVCVCVCVCVCAPRALL